MFHQVLDHPVVLAIGHTISTSVILGTLLGFLPAASAFVALVYYAIQIIESKTVLDFMRRRRTKKIMKMEQKLRDAKLLRDLYDPPAAQISKE